MNIPTIISWIVKNRKSLTKAILGLCVAFLVAWGITLSKQNKKLSESLELALNNIEAYLGSLAGSLLANNVLKLDIETLSQQNDIILNQLDSVREELKIKTKQLSTAATQTQVLNVNESKGVKGDLVEILKDTIYSDSINYNDLTKVYYTIGRDTVNIGLNIKNSQYLYVYGKREYKNKKNFLRRLFTFDFKKVTKYKYKIVNTNSLLEESDVRVVESIK